MSEASPYAFSLIVPLYRSEETIERLVDRLEAIGFPQPWQVIFVDDGSPDRTHALLSQRLRRSSLAALLVRHTRNFGEHQAVLTGYRHAEGEFFINIDDDLQNPPEEALRLLEYARVHDLDVVYGNYIVKNHDLFRNLGSGFANFTARLLLDLPHFYYLSSFRCVSRQIGQLITPNSSPYVYIDGLLCQVTNRIGSLDVRHDPRDAGKSGYNLRRLIRLWLVILTSFSLMPLRIATFVGLGSAGLGGLSFLYILVTTIFGTVEVAGWASETSSILFFGGIQCLLLGVLGEYIGRIYLTLHGKPQAHVRTVEWSGSKAPPLDRYSSRSPTA
ncbi:MAG: hypothetical protein ER33_15450 [Cyanobium sp. CACIAM 14]|nr:MAG: hypothetical protein ER33_15450 [Cyanobium sp. CACIAM 14]